MYGRNRAGRYARLHWRGSALSWAGGRCRCQAVRMHTWMVLAVALLGFWWLGTARAQVMEGRPPEGFQFALHWTVYDVDEGDAMLLTCGGESLLVDGGPQPFRDMLRRRLAEAGYMHLDTVLNTHYHDDHIDGLYSLFQSGFTAGEYLHGYSDAALAKDPRGSRTAKAAEAAGANLRRIGHGDALRLGESRIQVYQCTAIHNTNARSLVLHVTLGDTSLLLCADITGAAQHWLLENLPQDALSADLVKLPHHGINPTVTEFLDAVNPAGLVVTNRPDRIEPASRGQLDYRALPVWFSGDGTVHGVTDGVDWYVWQEGID